MHDGEDRGNEPQLVVLAALAGAFGSLDTALNIAFPDLLDDFDLRLPDLQWVVITYVLSYGVLLLAAGRLGDQIGHRRVMALGGIGSAVALGACALAPSFSLFLTARVLQGVATAMVMASAPALLTAGRMGAGARAASVFQTAAGAGLAVGPLLGGVAVAAIGWRGVFWFRIPIAAVLVVVARRAVDAEPRSAPGDTGRGQGPLPTWRIRRAPFAAANLATTLVNGSMFVTWLLVPTFLVDHVGIGAGPGGAVLAVSPLATAVAARSAPALGRRYRPQVVAVGGVAAMVGGLTLLAATAAAQSVWTVSLSLFLVGGGLGLFTVPNMAFVMNALPPHRQGVAGSLNLVMRTIGIVAGVAAAGALFDLLSTDRPFGAAFQWTVAAGAAVGAVTLLALGPAMMTPAALEAPAPGGGDDD